LLDADTNPKRLARRVMKLKTSDTSGNSVNRSNAAFGTVTATYDPRIIQFGVKANF
jgi:hypothetical protein